MIAAAAVLVVAVLAIAGVFSDDDDGGGASSGEDFGITAPEAPGPPAPPRTDEIQFTGLRPDSIAAGAGFVWATDSFSGKAVRINPRSESRFEFQARGFPTDVAAGEGAAWLALPDRGAVQRVPPRGGLAEPERTVGFPFQIAAGEGAVWAMSQKTVERIDPSSGGPDPDSSPTRLQGPGSDIAAGDGWVWVSRGNREVVRISPEDGELDDASATLPGAFGVTVGEGAVWALGAPAPQPGDPPPTASLIRIDPGSAEPVGSPVRIGQALSVAAGLGSVWIGTAEGTVRRIDPDSGSFVGQPIELGGYPQSIAAGEGAVWVADPRRHRVIRIRP